MVLPIVSWNNDVFCVVSHAAVIAKHFNGIHANLRFEDGYYLLDPDDGDTGVFDNSRNALVPKLTAAKRIVDDTEPEDEEPELEVVTASPKPLSKKLKRTSSQNATAIMAARQ